MEICTGEAVKAWKFIGEMLTIIKIAVPLILIIMGSVDLMKAVMANKADEIKKGQTMFIKRVLAGVIVFFVPTIVSLLLSFVLGEENQNDCIKCVLDTKTCIISE